MIGLPDYPKYTGIYHVGSRAICSPTPDDTDDDWLFLVDDLVNERTQLTLKGWGESGSQSVEPDGWKSLRKGIYNYILTDDADFFDKFILATRLCKRLNLKNKEDRIVVHEAALYNRYPVYDF